MVSLELESPHLKCEHSSLQCLQRELIKFEISQTGPSTQSLWLPSLAAADSSWFLVQGTSLPSFPTPPCWAWSSPWLLFFQNWSLPSKFPAWGLSAETLSLPGFSRPPFPFRLSLRALFFVKPPVRHRRSPLASSKPHAYAHWKT